MKAMIEMENAVMNMTGCPRETANIVVNTILDLEWEQNERCAAMTKVFPNEPLD